MADLAYDTLVEGKPVAVEVNGTQVCVAKVGDEVFAVADTCTHSEASLSEGEITGSKIECWLHGAEFDLRTGEALTPPATAALKTAEGTAKYIAALVKEKFLSSWYSKFIYLLSFKIFNSIKNDLDPRKYHCLSCSQRQGAQNQINLVFVFA